MPPHRVARFRGLDVVVVVTLLVTLGAMVPPAIHSSRYGVRVASCQDDLRQFGLALTDHSQRQGQALSELAHHGQLTRTGVFAAELLQDVYLTATHRTLCPDAWLAVQGLFRGPSRGMSLKPESPGVPIAEPRVEVANDWSGTWREATTDGWRSPPSAAWPPLLADAPNADLSGQRFPSHGGRGRNVLFDDGHAEFLPVAASVGLDDWFDSGDEDTAIFRHLCADRPC